MSIVHISMGAGACYLIKTDSLAVNVFLLLEVPGVIRPNLKCFGDQM